MSRTRTKTCASRKESSAKPWSHVAASSSHFPNVTSPYTLQFTNQCSFAQPGQRFNEALVRRTTRAARSPFVEGCSSFVPGPLFFSGGKETHEFHAEVQADPTSGRRR